MVVNAWCTNRGWLFEDLKAHFASAGAVVSDHPLSNADAWICIRASESGLAIDPLRTVLQIHDMKTQAAAGFGGYSLVNPDQAGQIPQPCRFLVCPIGASRMFSPGGPPSTFTVGWVGRNTGPNKGLEILRHAIAVLWSDVRLILMGQGLSEIARDLRRFCEVIHLDRGHGYDHAEAPGWYREMSALIITSRIEAGPLPLFEALASGVPVLSTPVGWASYMIHEGQNGYLYDTPGELVRLIEQIQSDADLWHGRRYAIRDSLGDLWLEDWIKANLRFAEDLCSLSQ